MTGQTFFTAEVRKKSGETVARAAFTTRAAARDFGDREAGLHRLPPSSVEIRGWRVEGDA